MTDIVESVEALKRELKNCYANNRGTVVAKIVTSLFKYGSIVWVFKYIVDIAWVLGGSATFADIKFEFTANSNVSVSFAWGFGIVGLLIGGYQAKLRKDTVEYLHTRIEFLEKQVDQNRTSSDLTKRGDTPQG